MPAVQTDNNTAKQSDGVITVADPPRTKGVNFAAAESGDESDNDFGKLYINVSNSLTFGMCKHSPVYPQCIQRPQPNAHSARSHHHTAENW